MKEKKEKRYSYEITEEGTKRVDHQWGVGGRIEVFDNQSDSAYSTYEFRFFVPSEFIDALHEMFDGKESDYPVCIAMDGRE